MISEEAEDSFGKNTLSPSNNLISLVGSFWLIKEVKSTIALLLPPPCPIGISLMISMRDRSVLEVIPPALLIALEMVIIFMVIVMVQDEQVGLVLVL